LIITATLAIALGAFSIYSSFFANSASSILSQEDVIAVSKAVQISVSPSAFRGLGPSFQSFNVTYIVWIKAPLRTLTLIPFVSKSLQGSLLYYELPTLPQQAVVASSSPSGLNVFTPFQLRSQIYLPQGNLLGNINAIAYNVSSANSFLVNAKVSPGQVIVIWVLYNYHGEWYRLAYTYLNPQSGGLGVYVLASSGLYDASNTKNLAGFKPPLALTNNKAFQYGMWFKPLNTAPLPATIASLNFTTLGSKSGSWISFKFFQKGSSVYVNLTSSSTPSNVQKLGDISVGTPYFLNLSYGGQLVSGQGFAVNLYTYNSTLKGSLTYSNLPGTSNGYSITVKFGASYLTDAISQAYLITLQDKTGLPYLNNASTLTLRNGFLYNNTLIYNWTVNHAGSGGGSGSSSIYLIAYWYFVSPYVPPPPTIPAAVWYWPNGNYAYAQLSYIYEVGQNTYVIT